MISSSTAAEVARGVSRLLIQDGYSPILEFTLPNGRRLDVAALGPGGEMLGVEIKVALADLRGDQKWPEYLDYCDLFYFAIPPDFPPEHVPAETGLIVADRYGGAIVKPAMTQALHASRRKAVTLSFAKVAAERLSAILETITETATPNLVVPNAALTKIEARKIALSLPGASEGLHFGKPAIFVGDEFLTRIHHKEEAVVILTGSLEMRDMMLEAEPKLFYIIEHYRKRPALLARLSKLDKKTLGDLLKPRLLRIGEKAPGKKPRRRATIAKKKS